MGIQTTPKDATLSARFQYFASGAWYDTTLTQIKALFDASDTAYQDQFTAQYEAPLTGANIAITDSSASTELRIKPAGTIAALTVTFPASTNAVEGQEILMTSSQIVTTLTLAGNGSTIQGGATAFTAGGFARYRFDATFTQWIRIG
jgi:hypothetical protein